MLVSVIVPSYNHSHFILECLSSILAQTHKNIELVIIDDGSVDNSVIIIQNFLNQNKQVNYKFFVQENKGISAALNLGLSNITGESVVVLASDDLLAPEAIEIMLRELIDETVGVVFGDSVIINQTGDVLDIKIKKFSTSSFLKWRLYGLSPGLFDLKNVRKVLLDRNIIPPGSMVRASVYKSIGVYDEHLKIEDYDMWLRASRATRFVFCNNVVSKYRIHGSNTIFTRRKHLFADNINLLLRERHLSMDGDEVFILQKRLFYLVLSFYKSYRLDAGTFRDCIIWVKKIFFR